MEYGAQSVTISGIIWMLLWSADNWDSIQSVGGEIYLSKLRSWLWSTLKGSNAKEYILTKTPNVWK